MGEVLEVVGLSGRAGEKVKTYSGGMKRRLNLAAGLLHGPEVLLLDEPTAGVDPQSRNAIFDTLESLRGQGKAILYTTHYMEEAERLCDRIVIVDHGKVIAEDTLAGLQRLLPGGNRLVIQIASPFLPADLDGLIALSGVTSASLDGERITLVLDDLSTGASGALAWLASRKVATTQVSSERVGLEEVFLTLTGRTLRDT
jgi:ABC-2 type transport system ATP-binding protein